MAQFVKQIGGYPRAIAQGAQPVIIAFSVAGFTGGALSAIGFLASQACRKTTIRIAAAIA
ncbi:hypothetical protein MTR62_08820 [Novosphingobium sp. 1949]|uniref:Uncharacterized protein n=1 Tax=Novosphingobium organovorum TaxID=2930092 RepID=A0ABT0BD65_9SPHN|nr:hypothetical protein [Novosphingobium organovorum]MCJ2182793.1 hypothetical protein [Novosphingobium organovorum]